MNEARDGVVTSEVLALGQCRRKAAAADGLYDVLAIEHADERIDLGYVVEELRLMPLDKAACDDHAF